MIKNDQLNHLRARAEKFLATESHDNQFLLKKDIAEVVNELVLHQVELEIQNDDLRVSQLKLEEFCDQYTELYHLAPVAYFTLDNNGLIIQVNRAGENLLSLEKHSLHKKSFSRYIAPESQSTFSDYKKNILEKISSPPCEVKLFKKKQSLFYAQLEGKLISNPKTHELELLVMLTDITHRKKTEEWSHQQQQKMASIDRMSSMGELASTIAHELNHPLSVISNYIHGCIRRLEDGETETSALLQVMELAVKQLHRASEIILRMRNFACNGVLNHEPVNIDVMLKETITLIHYEIQESNIAIHYRPTSTSLPNIMLDRIHIQQVILNLARNAIEAMRDSNTLEPKITIEANHIKKNIIEINVLDNGPGFLLKNMHTLFEPNFTTKAYGIGLGLAVSNTIIESHGGKLTAELNPTRGACFKIRLPITTELHES